MDLEELTELMHTFVRAQGWYESESPRPQTPRNLAMALSVEAAEVLELFHWNRDQPSTSELGAELADVTLYLVQLASISGVDLEQAVRDKLAENYDRSWPEQ
ncbi:MAG: nucleotide pyrophosphohydrolase [Anaerolineales bacterium]|nr:nucleotide pyrophosphohydrolase [Anaerolineales bacterium]